MVIKNGKVVIHAVHERDAKGFWNKIGLKKVEKCFVCGEDVTYKGFSAVAVRKGEVIVCCEKGSCFLEFQYKRKQK